MEINAAQVNELRKMTGIGLMLCKQALSECDGDLQASVDWLRRNGVALTTGVRAPGEGSAMAYDVARGGAFTDHSQTTEGCVVTLGNMTVDVRSASGGMHTVAGSRAGYLSVGCA